MLKFYEAYLASIVEKASEPVGLFKLLASIGLTCTLGFFILKTVKIYFNRRKYKHIPGPSTNGLSQFYFGQLGELNGMFKEDKHTSDFLLKLRNEYGDLYKFQLADKMFIFTSDKEAIKDIMITNHFPKQAFSNEAIARPCGEPFLGQGLVTEMDYEKWKTRRAIFNHGFHRNVLMTFNDHFNSVVNSLLEKLRQKADGKTYINLFKEINKATLDAIALIAFGMNTDAINEDTSLLNEYLAHALHLSEKLVTDPFFKLKPSNFNEIKTTKKMIRHVRKIGRDKITERINAFKNNEYMPNDILSAILNTYKGEDIDLEKMTDDFVTFFVAGQETTANTLAFCFLEIAKNQKILAKAREEIDRVLGERRTVTFQDVAELKYCSALFKETLRLFPPAAFISRNIDKNFHINGVDIPKDTVVFISTYVNARNEKYFKNAYEFRPERFLKNGDENEDKIENYIYLPFGLGPRNCIGQNFAQLEGVITIARFLQTFDLKLDPTQSFAIESSTTLRPKDGCRCALTLRE
jgi:cholesterol 24(S)-hydroxylase